MKKHIYLLMAVCAIAAGCRNASNKAADSHSEHTHTHADGTVCTGDHSHDEHESHDHAEHSHEPHVHTDGTTCTDDHSHDEHSHEAHVHDDGEVCTGDHSHDEHESHDHEGHSHDAHAGHDHGSENPDEISFPLAQQAKTDFAVETVKAGDFTEVIRTGGQILPAQGDERTLVSPVSGVVSFAGATLAEGQQVGTGQTLFYVSSKNIASGDIMSKNAAAYRKAKADLERMQGLLADRIVSQREYDEARLAYEQAAAEYNALSSSHSARGTSVAAPIKGYVTSLLVGEGDFVEMGQPLAAVSQNNRLKLRADVSQRYLARLRSVTSANFTVPYDNAAYRLADLGGKLISSGKNAAQGTTLLPVTFEFDNNGAVVPGTYVEVSLLGAPEHNALTLPLSAVTEQQGLYYVYRQLDPECFERQEVRIGADDGVRVKILSGIAEGQKIVVRGAVNVKMAAASGAIPHGHEH